jgi:hypothetical protein
MYMSSLKLNAVCQAMRVFNRWKYVHVESDASHHLSYTKRSSSKQFALSEGV